MGVVVGRDRELAAVAEMLERAAGTPAVLIVEGEAGIGKTSICRAASAAAQDRGFSILATSGATAEASLAWSALGDLVDGIDDAALEALSPLHQRVLRTLASGLGEPGCDERLVATAFRSALQEQSRTRPPLIVIDDAQWLDEPSRRALGFAMRRLSGPVAVVAAYRTGEAGGEDRSWVQPPDPQALTRLAVNGMTLNDLRMVLALHAGAAPPSSVTRRIHTVSGGNPFYALELARTCAEHGSDQLGFLPTTLAALIDDRIGQPDQPAMAAMTIAAAAFEPTIEVVAAALGVSPDDVVSVLQSPESNGLLVFDGPRIRFAHPLITSGVLARSAPAEIRHAHRRLAAVVVHAESRARHLAMSSPHGDPDTLDALDGAGESAATRGAYSAAAELVTLAIRLGGDNQLRRLRAAEYHFRAGALDEAEDLLGPIVDELPGGFLRAVGLMLLAAVRGYRHGIASTIGLFERAVHEAEGLGPLHTQAQVLLSLATGIGGDMASCVRLAREARTNAAATGLVELQTQALALWSHVSFMYGLGVDSEAMHAGLAIENPATEAPVMLQPTPVYALNRAWTGNLAEAHAMMTEVWRRCDERGNELDALWATEQLTWIDVAMGRYRAAELRATEAMSRARLIGGQLPLITAHTAIASAAAYRGRVEEARRAAESAIEGADAAGLHYLSDPPRMSMAFAEVSNGAYEAALQTVKPLLDSFDPTHGTEIMAGAWLPDAVEALTATGRTQEAEPLVAALEINGIRHDRPWMLAIGARCRGLMYAAYGDLDKGLESLEQSMRHHERLPMPFERGRTQLLLGQLQRRRRRIQGARANIRCALATFEAIGSPLWAARADRELTRLGGGYTGAPLTDSEQQVAELAAHGRTNKEIAAAMFVSEKTVEMHLSNTYRKLGIRSRTQLINRLRDY